MHRAFACTNGSVQAATARTPAPPPAASVGPPHTIAVNLPHRRHGACCPASAAQQDGSRLIHPVSQHQRTCRYLRFCDQCRGTGTVLRYACGKAEQQVGKTCQHGQSMQWRQAVQQATKQRWLWKAAVGKVGPCSSTAPAHCGSPAALFIHQAAVQQGLKIDLKLASNQPSSPTRRSFTSQPSSRRPSFNNSQPTASNRPTFSYTSIFGSMAISLSTTQPQPLSINQ